MMAIVNADSWKAGYASLRTQAILLELSALHMKTDWTGSRSWAMVSKEA